jgi:hypothetical protein
MSGYGIPFTKMAVEVEMCIIIVWLTVDDCGRVA